jgi:hypothetical protein
MNIKMTKSEGSRTFFTKIKQEIKVLSNISYILEKIEHDGLLKSIKDSFDKVLSHEMEFAISELTKIEKRNDKGFDLKNQLTNNTFIFKENLKIISNFASYVNS